MLSKEQAEQVREQIINQIDSSFPEESKEDAKQKILSMTSEELEEILKQNSEAPQGQCIFCSIVEGKAPAYKIDENEEAIAVLEINPISTGHVLVIPKIHSSNSASQKILQFAKDLSEKMQKILSAKEVKVKEANLFGHNILNLLPIYENETFESERKSAKPEELESLQKELTKKEEAKPKKKEEPKKKKLITDMKLPKRIP